MNPNCLKRNYHSVGFIQHQISDRIDVDDVRLHQIIETTRCGDDDFDTIPNVCNLRSTVAATIHAHTAK